MSKNYVCWKCGNSINDLPFPLSIRSHCSSCGGDLHVCKLCRFYDKTRANQCQEPIAEAVVTKTRANFCDYFQARPDAYQFKEPGTIQTAQQELGALFGEDLTDKLSSNDPDAAKTELEKLFGMKDNNDEQ